MSERPLSRPFCTGKYDGAVARQETMRSLVTGSSEIYRVTTGCAIDGAVLFYAAESHRVDGAYTSRIGCSGRTEIADMQKNVVCL